MRVAAFLTPGRSLPEAAERVRVADSLGYDSAWVTHIASREPLQVLDHYAHATERIGLGTGVVPLALRHPALLAMEAATLDEISGGRLRLGIGDAEAVRAKVEEYRSAGVTLPAVGPLPRRAGSAGVEAVLEAAAPRD